MRKLFAISLCFILSIIPLFSGCSSEGNSSESEVSITYADTSGMEFEFDDDDINTDYLIGSNSTIDLGNEEVDISGDSEYSDVSQDSSSNEAVDGAESSDSADASTESSENSDTASDTTSENTETESIPSSSEIINITSGGPGSNRP